MADRRGLVVAVTVAAVLVTVAGVLAAEHAHRSGTGEGANAHAATDLVLARVERTDVADRQQVPGTLGYAGSMTVVSQVGGTLTGAAAPGMVVRAGGVLASVDGVPVVLMVGPVPAWRPLGVGSVDGPDVRELERNLTTLGYDPQHRMTVDAHFSTATAAAVRRWQSALGVARTGRVELGSVAFLPRELRVTTDLATVGGLVSPGQPVVAGTSVDHEVAVALDAGRQGLVHVGDSVAVTLPDGTTTTRGVVAFVARVATTGDSGAAAGPDGGPAPGGAPTVQVTVRLLDQAAAGRLDQAPVQVAITDQLHPGVLAVPVTALLAVPGGYAVTRADGTDIPVSVGLFDDLTQLVEVSGGGLSAGMQVQVPRT
jgi:HlyD family secretion protein